MQIAATSLGLFGDTVNTASRMESNSAAGKILCTQVSATLLEEQATHIALKRRGKINGKGSRLTYWVGGTDPAILLLETSSNGEAADCTNQSLLMSPPPKTFRPFENNILSPSLINENGETPPIIATPPSGPTLSSSAAFCC